MDADLARGVDLGSCSKPGGHRRAGGRGESPGAESAIILLLARPPYRHSRDGGNPGREPRQELQALCLDSGSRLPGMTVMLFNGQANRRAIYRVSVLSDLLAVTSYKLPDTYL